MSVMNYCNPAWNYVLSAGDINGVRQFYGPPRGPDQQFLVTDVNGDRRDDILQAYRGWGTVPRCLATDAGWSCNNPLATVYNTGSAEQRYITGDFNGDGLGDVAQV